MDFDGLLKGSEPPELFINSDPDSFPTPERAGITTPDAVTELRNAATVGPNSVYIMAKVILGYDKLNERVHLPMCRFEYMTRRVGRRRLMLMPRGHFKTTIWTIVATLQEICLNPNLQILIVADIATNAKRFMRELQMHFERNELFRSVFSDIVPENFNRAIWNDFEMEVKRTAISRDPTVDAIGALGGSESRHYHRIKADDLITEKCIRSEVEMEKVIAWAGGLESLLTNLNEDGIDFVGSRKKKGDLYEVQEESYGAGRETVPVGPHAHQRGQMTIFTREARENGKVIFPEIISEEFLDRLRRYDPERYYAQYANNPKTEGFNTFDRANLRFYRWSPDGQRILCIHNGKVELDVSPWSLDRICFYDPAIAEQKKQSKQAFHVVGKGSHPFRIVLESRIGHFPVHEAVDYIFDVERRWRPNFFSIEKRGFQGSIKYWLEERAELTGVIGPQVIEWPPEGHPSATWAKEEHIKALQPIVRANCMWVHESMADLIEEFEFYPNVRWNDGLDSLSHGLIYWPTSIDELSRRRNKHREITYLEAAMLGASAEPEKEKWDEAKFLKQFDATGYSFLKVG